MKETAVILKTVLKHLKDDPSFCGALAAEINGTHFSAADIALPESSSHHKIYRLVVVEHKQSNPAY